MQRRCNACKDRRVQCDLEKPTCSQCSRRGVNCTYPPRALLWRNQNESAAESSRRSRTQLLPRFTVELQPAEASSTTSSEDVEPFIYDATPWLSSAAKRLVPPMLYSIDEKATMRFFAKWILNPCNHNICPGYFHDLPRMYHAQSPDSALRLAVEAAANAEIAAVDAQGTFATRSQHKYGRALPKIREGLEDSPLATDDSIIAAILVVDTFELVYTNERVEPLGKHAAGLMYLLRRRGPQQLFTKRGMMLFRLVHHRLQARQLLLGESPMPESSTWLDMLDLSRPDLRIAFAVLRSNNIGARANELLADGNCNLGQLQEILGELHHVHSTFTEWLDKLVPMWSPRSVAADNTALQQRGYPGKIRSTYLYYHDMWTARTWNFSRACRIRLHDIMLKVKIVILDREGNALSAEEQKREVALYHANAISELHEAIFQTVPTLLGLIDSEGHISDGDLEHTDVGLLFLLFPMWVVQRCDETSREHWSEAGAVLSLISTKMKRF